MKDRKGNLLNVGDAVFVLPADKHDDCNGKGYLRAFSTTRGERARIDDGPADMGPDSLANIDLWNWSAWVESKRIEKV
jgi:hypothetical protein